MPTPFNNIFNLFSVENIYLTSATYVLIKLSYEYGNNAGNLR